MAKPKIALFWCSSCGGCEESVLDMNEGLLEVAGRVEIIFWPAALDFKYKDIEAVSDGGIDAVLINGAVRTEEHERIVKLFRRKAKLVIANGACAHMGGVPGLANFFSREEISGRAYGKIPPVENIFRTDTAELPGLCEKVRPLNRVIKVDYYIPGCPPPAELVKKALISILDNNIPPEGNIFAEKKALCASCSRRDSKPDKLKIKKFKRIHETEWDPSRCFLGQDIICLGPVTRGGCEERCIKGNMPCRGCFGPVDKVKDQGVRALSFLASLLGLDKEEELEKAVNSIPDLAGLVFRYNLPSSMLNKKMNGE